ncbi:MAG: hypothetical protein ACI92I_000440 [Acidimicrobiales bacterium]|jgi:hypothetical protein
MTTTKKVAKGSVSKKPAVKKTAVLKSKKPASPKAVVKKSTPKVKKTTVLKTKKTASLKKKKTLTPKSKVTEIKSKVQIKNNTKKSASQKSNTKSGSKIENDSKTSFEEKINKFSFMQQGIGDEVERPVATKKPRSVLPAVAKVPMVLVALSATRFPMNIDTFAIQTARIGGVALVMLGAFFTLNFAQYIGSDAVMSSVQNSSNIATISGTLSGTDEGVLAKEPVSEPITEPTVELSPEPTAVIDISTSEPLSGAVHIKIKTTQAETVKLYALYKENDNQEVHLGRAQSSDADVWEFSWDTLKENANGPIYHDGNYEVVAYVANTEGRVFEFSSDSYYLLENNPISQSDTVSVESSGSSIDLDTSTSSNSETVTSDTSTSSNSETVTSDTSFGEDMTLRLSQESPVSKSVKLEIELADARQVKVYVKQEGVATYTFLSNAYQDGDLWRFLIDTTKYINGSYALKVQVVSTDSQTATKIRKFVIENDVSEETEPITVADGTKDVVDESLIDPDIALEVKGDRPLSGVAEIRVEVESAEFIELYVRGKLSGTKKFISLAKKLAPDSDKWSYYWDTTNTPNGEYLLTARVKNETGLYTSESVSLKIFNNTVFSSDKEDGEGIEESTAAITGVVNATRKTEFIKETVNNPDTVTVIEGDNQSEAEALTIEVENEVKNLLSEYREDLDTLFGHLASAIRAGDKSEIDHVKKRIDEFRAKILKSEALEGKTDKLIERINIRLEDSIAHVQKAVEKTEKIVTERIGEKITKDSDKDGITDYDEVEIYGTDPLVADSDGDGFADGAEILSGFNPKDPVAEAVVVFESPEEKGIVRSDILAVHSVETAEPELTVEPDGNDVEAFISGKGLPNSYVTLYIFSTPIVLTVKTDRDGSWNYRFDKELENGEHTVYVGMTDNTGRIVAKSNPFTFVKEAQAFASVDPDVVAASSVGASDDSLLSGYMMYLVLSISVVSIGLVLILLGLHLDNRRQQIAIMTKEPEMA